MESRLDTTSVRSRATMLARARGLAFIVLAGCSPAPERAAREVSDDSAMEPKEPDGGGALRGDGTCGWGEPDCRPCVPDVVAAFAAINPSAEHSSLFAVEVPTLVKAPPHDDEVPLDVFPGNAHFQSLARPTLALGEGEGDTRWLFLSKSGSPGFGTSEPVIPQTGLYVVQLEGASSGPAPWTFASTTGYQGALAAYYELSEPGLNHAGGLDTMGSVLALSFEHSGEAAEPRPAEVRFYDIRDPWSMTEIQRLVLDGSRGEPEQSGRARSTGVALARLADGTVLLFAGGQRSMEDGWFYRSDTRELTGTTRWEYLQYWSSLERAPALGAWSEFQTAGFVTECATGALFLLGLGGEESRLASTAALYALEGDAAGALELRRVAAKELRPAQADREARGCAQLNAVLGPSLRYGGGFYVSDAGGLVLYASGRNVEALDGVDGSVCVRQWLAAAK